MIRTQIQLENRQTEALRRLAAERHISIAALIREAVEALLSQAPKGDTWSRAMAIAGKFSSGLSDVSVHHDAYLDDAFGG